MSEPALRDIAVIWDETGQRCILSWTGDRYCLRVVRGSRVLKKEFGLDDRWLLRLADEWRAEILTRW